MILFCENDHGTGDATFPDVDTLDGHQLKEQFIQGNTVGTLRAAARKAGWGRVNGGDFCPGCMESM